MRVPKKIKDLPWPEDFESENSQIGLHVAITWHIIDGERLMVVTVRRNRNKRRYFNEKLEDAFRMVCGKKQRDLAVWFPGKPAQLWTLDTAMRKIGENAQCCYPEISEDDEKNLAKWLGEKSSYNHFLPQLNRWTEDICSKRNKEKAIERGEILDEDVDSCPAEISDGMIRYIRNTVLPDDNVLLYKRGNVRGLCYQCGNRVHANTGQRFKQNYKTNCPNCGSEVWSVLETGVSFKADYVENIATIQKGQDGETLWIRHWHILRDPEAKFDDITKWLKEISRYAIRGKRIARWTMEGKEPWYGGCYRYSRSDWQRSTKVSDVIDYSYRFYLPDDWRDILSGTSMQYCELEQWIRSIGENVGGHKSTIRFLIAWVRYPAMEKLWKAGYRTLCRQRAGVMDRKWLKTINWNADSIQKAIKFPMRFLKIHKPMAWDHDEVRKIQELLGYVRSGKLTEEELKTIAASNMRYTDIEAAFGHASVNKIVKYLGTQKNDTQLYRDYLKECIKLNWDLDDKAVLLPKNLVKAHERTIEIVLYEEDPGKQEKFAKRVRKLQKLVYEEDGLIIRPAKSEAELIIEGKTLHHCVAGYAGRMADGNTVIMVIRKAEEPDKPYYTLEWTGSVVNQCRTLNNRSYIENPKVLAFVNAWVEFLKQKSKKKEKKTA